MWLTSILVHSYVPDDLIKVVLVPLLKSKSGLITESNYYRSIALSNIFSKLSEHVILSGCEVYLTTSVVITSLASNQNTQQISVYLLLKK